MSRFRNDDAGVPSRLAPAIAMVALGVAVLIGACGPEQDDELEIEPGAAEQVDTVGANRAPPATATATRLTIATSPAHGRFLVAGESPVYLFTADTRAESSACHDDCASAWPPLRGPIAAGPGIDSTLVSSITRPDGTRQAVYDGWPLYVYVQDQGIEGPAGEGIESFGGTWHLLGPDGEPLRPAGADSAATDTAGVPR